MRGFMRESRPNVKDPHKNFKSIQTSPSFGLRRT